jgi:hypothetical protein
VEEQAVERYIESVLGDGTIEQAAVQVVELRPLLEEGVGQKSQFIHRQHVW